MSALVFDTSPISHFARAGELDILETLTREYERVVTQAVLDEVDRGIRQYPALAEISRAGWLTSVRVDGLAELGVFAEYARVLGSGERNVGEASTLAWAEIHGSVAIVDERAGTRRARERGVEVHGTLWLVANGCRRGELSERRSEKLVAALSDTEAWFPCDASEFLHWARAEGLL